MEAIQIFFCEATCDVRMTKDDFRIYGDISTLDTYLTFVDHLRRLTPKPEGISEAAYAGIVNVQVLQKAWDMMIDGWKNGNLRGELDDDEDFSVLGVTKACPSSYEFLIPVRFLIPKFILPAGSDLQVESFFAILKDTLTVYLGFAHWGCKASAFACQYLHRGIEAETLYAIGRQSFSSKVVMSHLYNFEKQRLDYSSSSSTIGLSPEHLKLMVKEGDNLHALCNGFKPPIDAHPSTETPVVPTRSPRVQDPAARLAARQAGAAKAVALRASAKTKVSLDSRSSTSPSFPHKRL